MLYRRAVVLTPFASLLRGQSTNPAMFGNAQNYERFMGRWSRLVAPRLVEFARIPTNGRVLDVGSGTGSLANAIAQHNSRALVTGIDPSSEYVAYATSRNPHPGRVTFEVGDAQQLSFPNTTFDAALSLLVFNFIPDPKKALRELRRVTKPGATIAAAVWDYADGMRMLRVFWDAVVHIDPAAEKLDEKHMPLCRQGQLSALWKDARIEAIREQPIEIQTTFDSFPGYWDSFLLGQGPAGAYISRLTKNKLPPLREELKRRLNIASENNPFTLPARVWAVRGIAPE